MKRREEKGRDEEIVKRKEINEARGEGRREEEKNERERKNIERSNEIKLWNIFAMTFIAVGVVAECVWCKGQWVDQASLYHNPYNPHA